MILQKGILILGKKMLSFLKVLLLFYLVNPAGLCAQDTNRVMPRRNSSSLYLRAPDVIPGTLPQMRDPSYWIAKMNNPDNVVMTLAEIQVKNEDYFKRMKNFSDLDSDLRKQINEELVSRPGLLTSIPDLNAETHAEVAAFVTSMVDKEIQFLTKRHWGNIIGIQYADQEIKAIENEIAAAKVPDQIKTRSAITVKDSRLRIIPVLRYEYVGYSELAGWDMWNFDIIPIATPVTILSTSKTGRFLFVICQKGYGWVNSEDVAIDSKVQIDNFCNSTDFIMCTGDNIPFYSDSACTIVSGSFRMGDHLGTVGNSTRKVLVPTRLINGRLSLQEAWLKQDADVYRGYLPYTRKNVVTQAFKLLDNIYDWTGGWYGRDHATQLRDIFSVFGFKLPSMGGLLTAYSDSKKVIYPKDGREAQYKAIMDNEPFLTLQVCRSGHSQMYLGNYNGVPIVFDTHGYRYTDKSGNELLIRRSNVGTISFPDYFLKQDIRFVELK